MKTKNLLAAGAVVASMAGGGVAGALLFTPQLSGAQETTTTTVAAAPHLGGHRFGLGGGAQLSVAATAIGISEADLRTALQGGKTIAEVAKDKGVDVQKVIDALVADAKAKLEQLEADLPTRMQDLVNGKLPLGGPREGFRGGIIGAGLDTAATALGMSEADLRTALQGGKSIADVAKDEGVDVQKVIDALVSAATKRIDQAVTDGKLTAAQATDLKAKLKDSITAFVNGTRPEGFGHHGFGGRGFGGPGFSGAGVAPGASYGA